MLIPSHHRMTMVAYEHAHFYSIEMGTLELI
jgi:hypothetical protein